MNQLRKVMVGSTAIIILVTGFIYWKSDQSNKVVIESSVREASAPNIEPDGAALLGPENDSQDSGEQSSNSSDALLSASASDPIEELQSNVNQLMHLKSLYFSGEISADDMAALVAEAISGNLTSAVILSEYFTGCDRMPGVTLSDEKKQICSDMELEMSNHGIEHPFFLIENAALEGDLFARYTYLEQLPYAVDSKSINPYTQEERWRQSKEKAFAWQLELARMGNPDSAFLMASQYMYGPLVEPSPLYALVFAREARNLGYGYTSSLDLIFERAMSAYEGSMQDVEDLYAQFFNP